MKLEKKLKIIITVVLIISILGLNRIFTGTTKNKTVETIVEKVYPVKVNRISREENIERIRYIGILQPEIIRKKTFNTIGEIEKIYVEEGQKIKIGDKLVKLNTDEVDKDLNSQRQIMLEAKAKKDKAYKETEAARIEYESLSAEPNQEEIDMAKALLESSKLQHEEVKAEHEQAKIDYDNGIIADEEFNQKTVALLEAEVKYRQAQISYELVNSKELTSQAEIAAVKYQASQAQYEAANANYKAQKIIYEQAQDMVENSIMNADLNGFVIQILSNPGEIVTPISPVIVLGSGKTIVTIGVSQDDIRKIQYGTKVIIKISESEFSGEITKIAKVPDAKSRTYEANISFSQDDFEFFIGETVAVEINVGEKEGIWIPINVVMNDGEDYVYIVEDERVEKKTIILKNIDNDYVLIEGIYEGNLLITEGMTSLKPGYKVNVTNDIEAVNKKNSEGDDMSGGECIE